MSLLLLFKEPVLEEGCSLDCPPSLLDYDVIGGMPVRVIAPDQCFICHTFSRDGELFATGDTSRNIKIWRTSDYALVEEMQDIHTCQMSFVDGGSKWLRILQRQGNEYFVSDVKVKRSDNEDQPHTSECHIDMPETTTKKSISIYGNIDADFSEDGNTLMIHKQESPVVLCRFEGHALLNCELKDPEIERARTRVPILSPDGQSVLAVYSDQSMSPETSETVMVWPKLEFDEHIILKGMKIDGNRAIWAASGEYLAVWDKQQDTPCLKVYKTQDLMKDDLKPIASRTLGLGLAYWHAIGCHQSSHSLLLYEVYNSRNQRYLEWDFSKNDTVNEISTACPLSVSSEEAAFVEQSLWRDTPQSQFYCINDGNNWIGSLHRTGRSIAIASCSSRATVFDCKLPEDVHFDCPMFDPSGRHFLIVGRKCILAFAPAFLRCSTSWQRQTVTIPEEALMHNQDGKVYDAFYKLHNRGIAEACNSSTEMIASLHDVKNSAVRYHRVARSSTGTWCAWIGLDRETSWEVTASIFGILYSDNSGDGQLHCRNEIIETMNKFYPSYVFVSPLTNGCERIVFIMARTQRPEILTIDMNGQEKRGEWMRSALEIKKCLSACQARDPRYIIILNQEGVCSLDVETKELQHLQYNLNFKQLFEFGKECIEHERWISAMENRRRLSDDKQTVLLGWNTRHKRSILATPTTEQDECKKAISDAFSCSPFCQLTRDGTCTLFVDVDELSNGRIAIGIYSHKDRNIRSTVRLAENIPILRNTDQSIMIDDCLFYDVTDDGSEIVTLSVPDEGLQNKGVSFAREMKKFTIYGTDACIPDYSRFIHSRNATATEKVQGLARKLGSGSAFNYPVLNGKSIFQEACLVDDKEMTQSIIQLAKHQNIKLAVQWPSATEEHKNDLLTHNLDTKVIHKTEEAIDLMTSDICTSQEAAHLWSQNLIQALYLAPHRIIKALLNDEFVSELCQVEVNAAFLDSVNMRDKALHVNTLDEIQPWTLVKDSKTLAEMWRARNIKAVEAMENDGKLARAKASLKVICIEDACRPGHDGLIRHLLLKNIPENVFRSRAVRWIVSHKWFKIWRKKFQIRACLHGGFLACLTAYSMILGRLSDLVEASKSMKVSSSVLLFIIWLYGMMMTREEAKQLKSLMAEGKCNQRNIWWGVRYYFRSKWNRADTVSCVLLLVLIPVSHFSSFFVVQCNPMLSAFVAIEVLLAYIKVWYFAQPFRITGALVLMVENIIKDCLAFLGLALTILLGFALAIHVISRSITSGSKKNNKVADAFGTFRNSILTLFYAVFAQFETEVYLADHDLLFMTITTFIIYMIIQIIVLLNMLISIMGDTFDRVKSNEVGQMLLARATIIDYCEASTCQERLKEMMQGTGKYIYAVERTDQTEDAPDTWSGRINTLVEKLRDIVSKTASGTVESVKRFFSGFKEVITTAEANLTLDVKEVIEEVKASKEPIQDTITRLKNLEDKMREQEERIINLNDAVGQHATQQTASIADLRSQMEENNRDILAKLETGIRLLQNRRAR